MQTNFLTSRLRDVAEMIHKSDYTVAITGAGISAESGIPPFRGENGLWSKYDPIVLELNYFYQNPVEAWEVIREIFYDFFGKAKPNAAHYSLTHLQESGFLQEIVTQNIDNLHHASGGSNIIEFHGSSVKLICTKCGEIYDKDKVNLDELPPRCDKDQAVLKPDFIFFGEGIPQEAYQKSIEAFNKAKLVIIIGTTGEVAPASSLPYIAKKNGAKIIEINTESTSFTNSITDIFLKGKAGEVLPEIEKLITGKL
ncbi:MAG: NAD-dependent deacylase [Bacteroidales bacterium]|nr:NAD-dependent deacylase [Bacteroidales bacterium]